MDFTALKTELSDRGFARLSDTQRGVLINRARAELDELETWPYREASVTGTPPLAISDLGEVDTVFDQSTSVSRSLVRRSYAELVNDYEDLSLTGFSEYWYKATPAGVPTVAAYPVSSSIGVQYWKVTADLSAGADTPASPARFHGLIVLIAERMALASKGDRAGAEAVQVEVDRWVRRMRVALLPDDALAFQIITGASSDW